MGANIGTTITSALVTIGQLRDTGELERGVAAASVHSLFNFMTVAVLFPIEICFGYLKALTGILVETAETGGKEDTYVGPVKRIVDPFLDLIIISNKKIVTSVAKGGSCDDFYPIECDPDFAPSYKTCDVGLIACDKKTGAYVIPVGVAARDKHVDSSEGNVT
jgi:solute carrier family 34 (sodium-dependent phosphate cotransporter)